MRKVTFIVLIALVFLFSQKANSCSMYKVTVGDKTVVGCNEDAWRTTPHIWFEKAGKNQLYGVAFTGSRFDGANGYAPQSGMNDQGLVYSRLSSYMPKDASANASGKKAITNSTMYLKDILHVCKTVEEVKAYIEQYDHSFFMEDVFIYVEKSGKYLVVEPYSLTIGEDKNYVLANFCPSTTSTEDARRFDRYRKGVDFINNRLDTTFEYFTALSDTMHVSREKIGDGTLLTSIWDANNGTVNLYFYHSYNKTVQFNLKDELAKGDHRIALEPLFPLNAQFENLKTYKTPLNSDGVKLILLGGALIFILTALTGVFVYLRNRKNNQFLWFIPICLLLFYYVFVLFTNVGIFYFSAPYVNRFNVFVSAASYIPLLLLIAIFPLVIINYKFIKNQAGQFFSKAIMTLGSLTMILFVGLFFYWHLYEVF